MPASTARTTLPRNISTDSDMMEIRLDKSPSGIRRGKYATYAIEAMSFEESIKFMESQIALMSQTEDSIEGRTAFKEKRKPVWTGR